MSGDDSVMDNALINSQRLAEDAAVHALENYGRPLRDIEGSLAARSPEHWLEVGEENE